MVSDAKRARLRTILAGGHMDALRRLVATDGIVPEDHGGAVPCVLPRRVPLINKVAAGYPADFTDLGYPARVADEYIMVPESSDPDLFAASVVGDSMAPLYNEGDRIVLSPALKLKQGMHCFCRFESGCSTFKQVFLDEDGDGQHRLRLHALNTSYADQVYPREEVGGVYPVLFHLRRVVH